MNADHLEELLVEGRGIAQRLNESTADLRELAIRRWHEVARIERDWLHDENAATSWAQRARRAATRVALHSHRN